MKIMNKAFKIFKVQLKSMLNFASLKTDKKQRRKIIGFVLLILCFVPSYFLYFSIVDILYNSLAALNQQSALLAIGAMGVSAVVLLFGFMYVFSALFGARDLDMLLAMPVKSWQITLAKLLNTIVYEYVIVLALMLPIVIMYAVLSSAGILYWVYSVIMLVFMPVIPISVATILDVIVIRIFSMRFNAEKIQTVFMIILLIAAFAFSFLINKMSSVMYSDNQAEAIISTMIGDNQYLINILTKAYPPAMFFASALSATSSAQGVLYLLAFVAVSIILFGLAVFICDKLYIGAVTAGISSSKSKKKKLSSEEKSASFKTASKVKSIFSVDMKVIFRTPVFAINLLLVIPVLPAVILISIISQDISINTLFGLLSMGGPAVGLYLIVICFFIATIVTMSSSSFSREGRAFWITQIVPVKAMDQLIGRCLGTMLASGFLSVLVISVIGIFLKWSAFYIIALILTSLVACAPIAIVGLLVDARKPKTDWDDAASAVKRNTNTVISMLLAMANAIVLGVIVLLLRNINVWITISILLVLNLIFAILMANVYIKKSPSMLQNE